MMGSEEGGEMRTVLWNSLVVILILALLIPTISCTKTVTEIVYVTVTPTPTPTPAWPRNLQSGQSIQWEGEKIIVLSAVRTYSYNWVDVSGTTYTETAPSGNVFIFIESEMQNLGADTFWASDYSFSLQDSAGYHYDVRGFKAEGRFSSAELYPGQKTGGKSMFTVPDGASGLKIVYNFAPFGEPQLAIWALQW